MCMNVCECTCVMQCPWRSGEGVGSPGTAVSNGCYMTYGCWELNPDPLQEQSMLLTPEPALQPHILVCVFVHAPTCVCMWACI